MKSSVAKNFVPPILLPALRRLARGSLRFSRGYRTWEEAEAASAGYSQPEILQKVASATRLVLRGDAAYERDGYVFAHADYSYPLVAMLLHAALSNKETLDVIDFGGALGSTYRQCLPLLKTVGQIRWQVIEQDHYVELGKAEFEDESLSFHARIEDIKPPIGGRRVLLLSSVLQYLRQPDQVLLKLIESSASHVLIDRTPVHEELRNRLCVQHVPKKLGGGSYPCWIMSRKELLDLFPSGWQLLAEFPCLDGAWRTNDGLDFEYRGMCLTND
jgi:putative methyltransferase (TIGR04325 family)